MLISTITSRMPDGTVIVEYENGYTFEGYVDSKHNPRSGVFKTPEGVKYDIPEFEEGAFEVFNLIKANQLERFRVKE